MDAFAITDLPQDLLREIISFVEPDFVLLACASKRLDEIVRKTVENNIPQGCIGVEQWKKYGAVEIEKAPPIPLGFYPKLASKKYTCTYIPSTINGEHLNLSSFDQLMNRGTG
jgi:hypothetical protein